MGPGRLQATLLTYGKPAKTRRERFLPGALKWADDGISINEGHNLENVALRAVPFLVGDDVVIDQMLPNTTRGRDIAGAMRADPPVYRGMSVEFLRSSVVARMVGGERQITHAELVGAALVTDPDYASAVEVRRQSTGGVALPSVRTMYR